MTVAFEPRDAWPRETQSRETGHGGRREGARDGLRWAAAAVVIIALHVGVAVVLRGWQVPLVPTEVAPPAVLIDLEPEPMPIPPELPPEPPPEPPPPEAMVPPEPEVVPPPPLPPEVVPEVVLPEIVPKPKPIEHKRVEHVKPRPVVTSPVPTVEALPLPAPPRPAPAAAAPADAMTPFERLISARLEQEKRYPAMSQRHGEQGTVMLSFTMNRAGKVLAASISRGSGFAALDREVLDLIRRVQPLPAMPPEITQPQLELVVPVSFGLK